MTLARLEVTNFRNIATAELSLVPGVNLFCGLNGSGKTSLLEAVHMLSTGRSFRSRQHKSVIREGSSSLTVFASLDTGDSLGVERLVEGGGRIRINRAAAESSSQLAARLPLQVINSDSFSALNGGPGVRRRLLDWAVFHVEHSFTQEWKNYQTALQQRNALLRRGKIDPDMFLAWEQRLAESGERLDHMRRNLFGGLKTALENLLAELKDSSLGRVEISYRRGWRKELDLLQALKESREGDLHQGYTRIGPHRADLRFSVAGEAAHQILSRGQQKMLVCALRTAMAQLVSRHKKKPVFLVDDLPSELDEVNQLQFARWVSRCASQVLVTGIEVEATSRPWRMLPPLGIVPKCSTWNHGRISAEPPAPNSLME